MILVILPHQLFKKSLLPKQIKSVVIWEHPHYFTEYRYNKKKLLLHRLSMKQYYQYLKSTYRCRYVDFNDSFKINNYVYFDPVDAIEMPNESTMIESPNFLLTKQHYMQYREKTTKFFFNPFYMWGKVIIDVLPNVKSMDKMNRKKMPHTTVTNKLPRIVHCKGDGAGAGKGVGSGDKSCLLKSSMAYVEKHFGDNIGNLDGFVYPTTHKDAKRFLNHFVTKNLKNFGIYQDAIDKEQSFLFHSILSSSINIGLLTPADVVKVVMKKKKPLNSIEGFIRQLFWREYQRYCYIYCDFKGNYFGNRKKLTKKWYTGNVGIEPVDVCIRRGIDTGYLHHIERLMIVGNYMNLFGLHPREGYRWFMEFSIDSYDWVMHQNVYDMVFFVTGGATMRRPYCSTSNYVLKMSNYKKGDWCETWDNTYHSFVKSRKKKLYKFRYYFKSI